jgi:hypothetical protein
MLTEEKLDDVGARLEHTSRKSLKLVAQETEVSKSNGKIATHLLKLVPYETTFIHALQSCNPAGSVHFCTWFLQSIIEGEINLQLTFFSDEAWFDLWGYINTQNNRC